jgi:5'-nucleotidase
MRILLSNDDGYKAAGIHVLARVMAQFGDVTVVAPKYHQSAMSIAVSLGVNQLAYKELPEERPGNWSYLDATPASCVKFGLQYKYEARNPDLVVSGVNHGSNASTGANYSATLGAAEEAAINGIKAIGVSITSHRPDADLSAVERLLPGIVRDLLEHWPEDKYGLYYNVNFPDVPLEMIKGVKWARQGKGHWIKEFEQWDEKRLVELGLTDVFLWQQRRVELEPGEKAFFMKGEFVNDDDDPSSADHLLVKEGWITIVPCTADLTDYQELAAKRG